MFSSPFNCRPFLFAFVLWTACFGIAEAKAGQGFIDLSTSALTVNQQVEDQIPEHFSLMVNPVRKFDGCGYLHDTFVYPADWKHVYFRLSKDPHTDEELQLEITRAGWKDNEIQAPVSPRSRKRNEAMRAWHIGFKNFPSGTRKVRLLLEFAEKKEDFDTNKMKTATFSFYMLIVPKGSRWQKDGDLYWVHDPDGANAQTTSSIEQSGKFRLWSYGDKEHTLATMNEWQFSNHGFFKYKVLGPYSSSAGLGKPMSEMRLPDDWIGDLATPIGKNHSIEELNYSIKPLKANKPTQAFIKLVRKAGDKSEGTVVLKTPTYTFVPKPEHPEQLTDQITDKGKLTVVELKKLNMNANYSGKYILAVNIHRPDGLDTESVPVKLTELTKDGEPLGTLDEKVAYFTNSNDTSINLRFTELPVSAHRYVISFGESDKINLPPYDDVALWQLACFNLQKTAKACNLYHEPVVIPELKKRDVWQILSVHSLVIILAVLGLTSVAAAIFLNSAKDMLEDETKDLIQKCLKKLKKH